MIFSFLSDTSSKPEAFLSTRKVATGLAFLTPGVFVTLSITVFISSSVELEFGWIVIWWFEGFHVQITLLFLISNSR